MSARPSFEFDPFQKILASAYVVQESGMDPRSLAAIVELKRCFASGKIDIDAAMEMIADRARAVANAAGIAIALLNRDQLVYRAGSGSAASFVGRRVMATLNVASHNAASEILRVENAQTDSRIEAAVCRQLGAESLLILPVYCDGTMAGVLEVFFSEAHSFADSEVRIYQLMAGLVEEAMQRAGRLEKKRPASEAGPRLVSEAGGIRAPEPVPASEAEKHPVLCEACGAAVEKVGEFQAFRPAQVTVEKPAEIPFVPLLQHNWKFGMAVAALLAMVTLIGYREGRATLPASAYTSTSTPPAMTEPEAEVTPANFVTAQQEIPVPDAKAKKPAKPRGRWVRVGDTEIDYVTEDVTVRHFLPKPSRAVPRAPMRESDKGVKHIGNDVTVRYFTPKREASSSPQSLNR